MRGSTLMGPPRVGSLVSDRPKNVGPRREMRQGPLDRSDLVQQHETAEYAFGGTGPGNMTSLGWERVLRLGAGLRHPKVRARFNQPGRHTRLTRPAPANPNH